jgi:hypothetical protein
LQRQACRVRGGIGLIEEHFDDIRAQVGVVFGKLQTAAHPQQVLDPDVRARIGLLPLGPDGAVLQRETALANQRAGERVQYALGH